MEFNVVIMVDSEPTNYEPTREEKVRIKGWQEAEKQNNVSVSDSFTFIPLGWGSNSGPHAFEANTTFIFVGSAIEVDQPTKNVPVWTILQAF
jgi:hypothetical protein